VSQTASPISSSVAAVYGEALYELAEQAGEIDAVAEEVAALAELLDQQPELTRLLASEAIASEAQRQSLRRVFEGQVGDLLWRFIQVVHQKGRFAELGGLLRAFLRIRDERAGVIEVEAWVAGEHDAATLAQDLGGALGGGVKLHAHRDDALIGGLKIRIGDRVLDGSVATRLRLLRRHLVDVGRRQAREAAGAEETSPLPALADLDEITRAAAAEKAARQETGEG